MTAREIMTPNPVMVPDDMPLFELANVLRHRRIHGVPVVDSEGIPVGVITLTDLFRFIDEVKKKEAGWLAQLRQNRDQILVRDIMTKNVSMISQDMAAEDVLNLMMKENIHTLPVLSQDKKEIVGIVGSHDVLYACLKGE